MHITLKPGIAAKSNRHAKRDTIPADGLGLPFSQNQVYQVMLGSICPASEAAIFAAAQTSAKLVFEPFCFLGYRTNIPVNASWNHSVTSFDLFRKLSILSSPGSGSLR